MSVQIQIKYIKKSSILVMSKQSCITKFVVCSSVPTVPSVLVATVILKIIKGAGTRKVTRRRENEGKNKQTVL